jgi:hypothetical protein
MLIATNSAGVLYKTLLQLASSPEERRRLAVGAKHTAERFRYSAMVQETEDVLQTCIYLHIEREKGRAVVPSE